jgi:transposase
MSLHSHASYPIPDETQRVARTAFPRGNLSLQVADCLGAIYHDAQFAALFPTCGQPAASPAQSDYGFCIALCCQAYCHSYHAI